MGGRERVKERLQDGELVMVRDVRVVLHRGDWRREGRLSSEEVRRGQFVNDSFVNLAPGALVMSSGKRCSLTIEQSSNVTSLKVPNKANTSAQPSSLDKSPAVAPSSLLSIPTSPTLRNPKKGRRECTLLNSSRSISSMKSARHVHSCNNTPALSRTFHSSPGYRQSLSVTKTLVPDTLAGRISTSRTPLARLKNSHISQAPHGAARVTSSGSVSIMRVLTRGRTCARPRNARNRRWAQGSVFVGGVWYSTARVGS